MIEVIFKTLFEYYDADVGMIWFVQREACLDI